MPVYNFISYKIARLVYYQLSNIPKHITLKSYNELVVLQT